MTITAEPRTEREQTPESQNLAKLTAMLDDPDLAGFRAEIQCSIDELRAKTMLRAN